MSLLHSGRWIILHTQFNVVVKVLSCQRLRNAEASLPCRIYVIRKGVDISNIEMKIEFSRFENVGPKPRTKWLALVVVSPIRLMCSGLVGEGSRTRWLWSRFEAHQGWAERATIPRHLNVRARRHHHVHGFPFWILDRLWEYHIGGSCLWYMQWKHTGKILQVVWWDLVSQAKLPRARIAFSELSVGRLHFETIRSGWLQRAKTKLWKSNMVEWGKVVT